MREEHRRKLAEQLLPFDWKVLEVEIRGNDVIIEKHFDYRPLEQLEKRPGLVHFAAQTSRIGEELWVYHLEHTYFPPGSRRNDDFEQRLVLWMGMLWDLVSIPAKCRRFADRAAGKFSFRIADGFPLAISSEQPGKPERFPIHGPSVFTLEYAGPQGHKGPLVWATTDPFGFGDAKLAEHELVARLKRELLSHPWRN